jgi:hypothetical protein
MVHMRKGKGGQWQEKGGGCYMWEKEKGVIEKGKGCKGMSGLREEGTR